MKVDFMNFILNITKQAQRSSAPNVHQGFCAVDLEPLFDNSAAQSTARTNWANAEFIKGTLPGTSQSAVTITHLHDYVFLASELANGNGGNPGVDHPVTIVWTLNYDFSSIIDLQAFQLLLRTDFATALGIPITRIFIDFVRAPSSSVIHIETVSTKTQIGFHISAATDSNQPTAVSLGQYLNTQFNDPHSAIYSGTITSHTDSTTIPTINGDITSGGAAIVAPSMILALFAVFFAFFFTK